MIRIIRTAALTLGLAVAGAAALSLPAKADVNVVVNGQSVGFDQPPITRAGRVFVPLRGVFERLGASVVYDNGLINATGSGHNISLRIGSTQATIDGQTQYVDVAPFVIGSRTLVPLRFVAQALGAAVEWDQSSQTVRINGGGNGGYTNPPAGNGRNYLRNLQPGSNSTVPRQFTITGTTAPASQIHVTVTGSTSILGGIFSAGNGTFESDVVADNYGRFQIPVRARGAGRLTVLLVSTSPDGATAQRSLVYNL